MLRILHGFHDVGNNIYLNSLITHDNPVKLKLVAS